MLQLLSVRRAPVLGDQDPALVWPAQAVPVIVFVAIRRRGCRLSPGPWQQQGARRALGWPVNRRPRSAYAGCPARAARGWLRRPAAHLEADNYRVDQHFPAVRGDEPWPDCPIGAPEQRQPAQHSSGSTEFGRRAARGRRIRLSPGHEPDALRPADTRELGRRQPASGSPRRRRLPDLSRARAEGHAGPVCGAR
jgi:hypothetical protein